MRLSSTVTKFLTFFLVNNACNKSNGFQHQIRQTKFAAERSPSSAGCITDRHYHKKNNRQVSYSLVRQNMILTPDATLWGVGDIIDHLPSTTVAVDQVVANLATKAAQGVSRPSPTLEVEVLNNMSHVALDLFGFLNPERVLLRLSTLLGRIMLMAADYDADQYISTDEILFQGGMLALSFKQFISSWQKMSKSSGLIPHYANNNGADGSSLFRERVVYHVLFSTLGISWLQFRTLVGSCIDWVDVLPNHGVSTINQNGEHVAYWLYNGKVSIKKPTSSVGISNNMTEQTMHNRRGKPIESNGSTVKDFGLITGPGIMSALVDDIDVFMDNHKSYNKAKDVKKNKESYEQKDIETLELVAGNEGATMMQINIAKLKEIMDDDEKLDKIVRNLILISIRNRMKTMMTMSSSKNSNSTSSISANETVPVMAVV